MGLILCDLSPGIILGPDPADQIHYAWFVGPGALNATSVFLLCLLAIGVLFVWIYDRPKK